MWSLHRSALLALAVALATGCQSGAPTGSTGGNALYDGGRRLLYEVEAAPADQRSMAVAEAAQRAGDTDRALFIYLQVAEKNPDLSRPLIEVSRIHRSRGNLDLAEQALRQVLSRRPDDVPALAELGGLQLYRKQQELALGTLQRALVLDQKRQGASAAAPVVDAVSPVRLYHGLGVLADLKQDFDAATRWYALARLIEPRSPLVANSQGYSRYLAGDWDAAAAHYREAIGFDVRYERAWRNLGLLLARQQRYEEALAAFEQVESRAQASNDVGYACMLDGRFPQAESFFRQAMELSPSHYETARQNLERLQQLQRIRQQGNPS